MELINTILSDTYPGWCITFIFQDSINSFASYTKPPRENQFANFLNTRVQMLSIYSSICSPKLHIVDCPNLVDIFFIYKAAGTGKGAYLLDTC